MAGAPLRGCLGAAEARAARIRPLPHGVATTAAAGIGAMRTTRVPQTRQGRTTVGRRPAHLAAALRLQRPAGGARCPPPATCCAPAARRCYRPSPAPRGQRRCRRPALRSVAHTRAAARGVTGRPSRHRHAPHRRRHGSGGWHQRWRQHRRRQHHRAVLPRPHRPTTGGCAGGCRARAARARSARPPCRRRRSSRRRCCGRRRRRATTCRRRRRRRPTPRRPAPCPCRTGGGGTAGEEGRGSPTGTRLTATTGAVGVPAAVARQHASACGRPIGTRSSPTGGGMILRASLEAPSAGRP